MPTPRELTVRAHAKINLDLRVLGERADGYHEVRTVLQSLRLHDTLTVTVRPGPFVIECDDPTLPTGEQNLVWRAAALLHHLRTGGDGPPRGALVRLTKRVPAQAGLGGGSADAAAALLALTHAWDLPCDLSSLARIGARLGADVPFFLGGGTALGSGRGDEISPLQEPPPTAVVLVTPPFGVSTPDAYRWLDEDGTRARSRRSRPRPLDGWPAWAVDLHNDLEPPVTRRHPAIARLVRALTGLGAVHAAMSGSGSAVFGLFATRAGAVAAQATLARRGWNALATQTLSREAVARQRRRLDRPALAAARSRRID